VWRRRLCWISRVVGAWVGGWWARVQGGGGGGSELGGDRAMDVVVSTGCATAISTG